MRMSRNRKKRNKPNDTSSYQRRTSVFPLRQPRLLPPSPHLGFQDFRKAGRGVDPNRPRHERAEVEFDFSWANPIPKSTSTTRSPVHSTHQGAQRTGYDELAQGSMTRRVRRKGEQHQAGWSRVPWHVKLSIEEPDLGIKATERPGEIHERDGTSSKGSVRLMESGRKG